MNKTAFADTSSDFLSRLHLQEEELFDLFIEDQSTLPEGPYIGHIVEAEVSNNFLKAYIRIPEIHDFILPTPCKSYSDPQNKALKSMLVVAIRRNPINGSATTSGEVDYRGRQVKITFLEGSPVEGGKMRGASFTFIGSSIAKESQFCYTQSGGQQLSLTTTTQSNSNSTFLKNAQNSSQLSPDKMISGITKKDFVLLFGDSQMQPSTAGGETIGKLLEKKFKAGRSKKESRQVVRVGMGGWTPAKYVNNFDTKLYSKRGNFVSNSISSHLQKKPKLIIIVLGGNGVDPKAKYSIKLIEKIKSITPESQIIWIGPPPPASDGTDYNLDGKLLPLRRKRNKILEDNISSKVNKFINSYKVRGFNQGYSCSGKCDGVHLPGVYAQRFLKQAGLL